MDVDIVNWKEIKDDAFRILVFVALLIWSPAIFGISWSESGDNAVYLSMGLMVFLVLLFWIIRHITGIQNNFLFFGIIIGGGFAISWQTSHSLPFALGFLLYGIVVLLLLVLYQKVNYQRVELVSDNILTLALTLIAGPVLFLLATPVLFSLDTIPLIVILCLLALVMCPVLHRYMHPVPDHLLGEEYSEEIIIPVSRVRAYRFCREAVRFLPDGEIVTASENTGVLNITAADSVGRKSRLVVRLEGNGQSATNVNIHGENEFIDSEYRILTGRNEMFVKIIIRYLEMRTMAPGAKNACR